MPVRPFPASSRPFELERRQRFARPPEAVFAFFADPRNLERITPGWLRFRVLEAPERLERGSVLRYRLQLFRVPVRWRTEISEWKPPRSFVDVQVAGPYPLWVHAHRFVPVEDGTEVYDHVLYQLPGGSLAPLVRRAVVGRWLEEIFDYRRERLEEIFRGGSSASNPARRA